MTVVECLVWCVRGKSTLFLLIILLFLLVHVFILTRELLHPPQQRSSSDENPPATTFLPSAHNSFGRETPLDRKTKRNICDPDFQQVKYLSSTSLKLLAYLKCKHFTPPSTLPYNLELLRAGARRHELLPLIFNIFANTKTGFFIDCYAGDDQSQSLTLTFEKQKLWSGLLIEPRYEVGVKLREKNRKAWIADACVSHNTTAYQSEIQNRTLNSPQSEEISECFPLLSFTRLLKISHVNFLTLDVGGGELNVLKTLPFNKLLQIDVILTAYEHENDYGIEMNSFLISRGYFAMFQSPKYFLFAKEHKI